MNSLRARLFVAWTLSLLAAAVVGTMLVGLHAQSSGAQQERAAEVAVAACEAITDRWSFFATGWAGPLPEAGSAAAAQLRGELGELIDFVLGGHHGQSGGLWVIGDPEPLAASAPINAARRASLLALLAAAAEDGRASARLVEDRSSILLATCLAAGPVPGLVAFVAAEVPETPGRERLILGASGLFLLVLAMTLLLGWAALAWARRLGVLEAALGGVTAGPLPPLALTGERDLDRLVVALNAAGARLAGAQAEAATLAERVAAAERLAALGRIAAGVAHEVRNPVAAMRLRAENGLAGDDARRRAALEAILDQIGRLERLTAELLTMTQHREPAPVATDVGALLRAVAAEHAREIIVTAPELRTVLDAGLLRRALDELLRNAARHTPAGGRIALDAVPIQGGLRLSVADTGEGVPASLQATLFEPFVSGRADGTGLGLAIAREMVEALGGTLVLAPSACGARFVIEVPCPAS